MFSFLNDIDRVDTQIRTEFGENILLKGKKKIKSRIGSHGATMLESVFDYLLTESNLRKTKIFDVSAYFFFPPQMNINQNTYPRENFYRDLSPFYRLNEPKYTFRDFIGMSRKDIKSPIELVLEKIDRYQASSSSVEQSRLKRECIDYIRVFSASYVSYILQKVSRRVKKMENIFANDFSKQNFDKAEKHLLTFAPFVRRNTQILAKFLTVKKKMTQMQTSEGLDEILEEFDYAHEYCFYKLKEGISALVAGFSKRPSEYDGEVSRRLGYEIKVWSRALSMYAKHHGFIWIDAHSHSGAKERFLYRLGFLKKRIWQVLFLETKIKTGHVFQQQFSYMVAAGFAALWAFIANILTFQLLPKGVADGEGSAFEELLGVSGFLVVCLSVFAYILKDRIKEVGRSKLYTYFFGRSPDYQEKVKQRRLDGSSQDIGLIKEWLNFSTDRNPLPDDIKKVRLSFLQQKPIRGESVLHYRKQLKLMPERLGLDGIPIRGLKDILRFDLSHFIQQLADPSERHALLSPNGEVVESRLARVYYLDFLVKYRYFDSTGEKQTFVECERLVINKNGLVRIESIL